MPTEDPDFGLSWGTLAQIGRLAIAMQKAADASEELRERAEAEGWLTEPTGSSHIADAERRFGERWKDFMDELHKHGLTRNYQPVGQTGADTRVVP